MPTRRLREKAQEPATLGDLLKLGAVSLGILGTLFGAMQWLAETDVQARALHQRMEEIHATHKADEDAHAAAHEKMHQDVAELSRGQAVQSAQLDAQTKILQEIKQDIRRHH